MIKIYWFSITAVTAVGPGDATDSLGKYLKVSKVLSATQTSEESDVSQLARLTSRFHLRDSVTSEWKSLHSLSGLVSAVQADDEAGPILWVCHPGYQNARAIWDQRDEKLTGVKAGNGDVYKAAKPRSCWICLQRLSEHSQDLQSIHGHFFLSF